MSEAETIADDQVVHETKAEDQVLTTNNDQRVESSESCASLSSESETGKAHDEGRIRKAPTWHDDYHVMRGMEKRN